jgi:ribosomal protein S18 acetylase RimI-like enzyme
MYWIRPITRHEYVWITSKTVYNLFSQLTQSVLLSEKDFHSWFNKILTNPCCTFFGVIDAKDKYSSPTLVGVGTLWIPPKYYRQNRQSGHIEDIIVDKDHRDKGLGKELMENIINYAKKQGCHKVKLHCSKENQAFYEKLNFKNNSKSMEYEL